MTTKTITQTLSESLIDSLNDSNFEAFRSGRTDRAAELRAKIAKRSKS